MRICKNCGAEITDEKRRVYCSNKCRVEYVKRSQVIYKYGMSVDEYDHWMEAQEGVCDICEGQHERLVIDHDHETGVTRGILCYSCNIALGYYEKYSDRLGNFINYLRQSK